ncbi:hypothetical protein V4V56_003857 [Vibrio mimicus]|nr:hypothetical protein [Vibrio cholerae]HDZ9215715.1 hypothetical protein [Vibrio cholerae]
MEVIFWLTIGVIASAVLIKFVHHKSSESRLKILGYALIIAAFIYVLFAVLASNLVWIGIESLGVLLYGAFFVLSKSRSSYLLAVGWLLHPVWDVSLHLLGSGSIVAPEWYVIMCISFDITVACYLLAQARVGKIA